MGAKDSGKGLWGFERAALDLSGLRTKKGGGKKKGGTFDEGRKKKTG